MIARIEAEQVGATSLTTRETIRAPARDIVAEARVVTVRWDAVAREPTPFSAAERALLSGAAAS